MAIIAPGMMPPPGYSWYQAAEVRRRAGLEQYQVAGRLVLATDGRVYDYVRRLDGSESFVFLGWPPGGGEEEAARLAERERIARERDEQARRAAPVRPRTEPRQPPAPFRPPPPPPTLVTTPPAVNVAQPEQVARPADERSPNPCLSCAKAAARSETPAAAPRTATPRPAASISSPAVAPSPTAASITAEPSASPATGGNTWLALALAVAVLFWWGTS